MDIKEIALKVAQATNLHYIVTSETHTNDDWNIRFAEALIESYKAELLKEVVEPVLYAEFAEDGGWLGDASEYADHLEEPHALFTSDQVAAEVLKATKPLIEERYRAVKRMGAGWIEVCDSGILAFKEMNDELRAKLAAAQQQQQTTFLQLSHALRIAEDQLADAQEEIARQRDENVKIVMAMSDTQINALAAIEGSSPDDIATIGKQCFEIAKLRVDLKDAQDQLAKAEQRVSEYNELIYAVQTKNPDETRHQTALRYIRNAENRPSNTAANGASS